MRIDGRASYRRTLRKPPGLKVLRIVNSTGHEAQAIRPACNGTVQMIVEREVMTRVKACVLLPASCMIRHLADKPTSSIAHDYEQILRLPLRL